MKLILFTSSLLLAGLYPVSGAPPGLEALLARARETHPGLKAGVLEAEAARHEVRGAGAWQDPEFEAEAENIGGDKSGTDEAELTWLITQPVETGGKRKWRKRGAELEQERAELERVRSEQEMVRDVTGRFYQVLAQQAAVALSQDALDRAEAFVKLAKRRVESGSGTALEMNKAKTVFAQRRLAALNEERTYDDLLADLSVISGWTNRLSDVTGDLEAFPTLPAPGAIAASLRSYGDYRDSELDAGLGEAQLGEARAARIPDLALSVGLRQDRAEDIDTYVAAVGFALPLWNGGRADVRAARAKAEAAHARQEAAGRALESEARRLHRALSGADREVRMYREELLPVLEKNATQAEHSYRQGWIEYLELLDAQDSLLEAVENYTRALLRYHLAWLETNLHTELK